MEKIKKLKTERPSQEEAKFAKQIDLEILERLANDKGDKHAIENAVLTWAIIEQIYLPRIIRFIGSKLKINISEFIERINQNSLNLVYFCLSHDIELFKQLEKSRKKRNKVSHDLIKQKDLRKSEKMAIISTQENVKTIEMFIDRFSGKKTIPSLTIYSRGWNDCRAEIIRRSKKWLGSK